MKDGQTHRNWNRRGFLAGTGGALAGFTLMEPGRVWGGQANSKIRLGLIGCGGRGTWIARLFERHGGYQLVAAADYFPERVAKLAQTFQIPPSRAYSGLSGHKRLLDNGGVDAVAIETPPYFHPEQAAAAVDAGVHVYLAKPIAVDVPGCRSVEESGRRATSKKLCFLVDFQTRANALYQEALRRVHQGALGQFAFGEASYHAGDPFTNMYSYLADDPQRPENRLRAWGLDRELSGDIITEQNIHTLDVMNWIMDQPPLSACGTGGRKVRRVGTCYDCFTLVFQYPNAVGITFSSRQFFGHRTSPEGIRNRMFGDAGVLETEYGGDVLIRSDDPFPGGKTSGIYEEGAVNNIKTFHDDVRAGRFSNPTVAPSVQSNLITILGREAAYSGAEVTWAALIQSDHRLEPDLAGLKD